MKYLFSTLFILVFIFISILLYPVKELPSLEKGLSSSNISYELTEDDLRLFQDYLKLPTIRSDEHLASLFLKSLFESHGHNHGKIINLPEKNRSIFFIEFGPDNPKKEGLIFMNHTDVVEFDEELWNFKQGEIHKEIIYGRGALDMKGLGFSQAIALINFLKKSPKLSRRVMFLALPDEETSGTGAEFFTQNYKELLSNYKYLLNEGGVGTLPGKITTKKLFNVQFAEKALLWLDVWSESIPTHASTPPEKNSTSNLILFLNEMLEKHRKIILSDQSVQFFSQLSKALDFPGNFLVSRITHPLVEPLVLKQLKKVPAIMALLRNTLSVSWLNSNLVLSYNRIPAKAKAKLDIRLLPNTNLEEHLNDIKKIAEKYDVKFKVFQKRKSTQSNLESPFFQTISQTAQGLYPDAVITPLISTGITDSAKFRELGIDCFGIIPTFISEEKIQSMHGPNESISKKQLNESINFLIHLLQRMDLNYNK